MAADYDCQISYEKEMGKVQFYQFELLCMGYVLNKGIDLKLLFFIKVLKLQILYLPCCLLPFVNGQFLKSAEACFLIILRGTCQLCGENF